VKFFISRSRLSGESRGSCFDITFTALTVWFTIHVSRHTTPNSPRPSSLLSRTHLAQDRSQSCSAFDILDMERGRVAELQQQRTETHLDCPMSNSIHSFSFRSCRLSLKTSASVIQLIVQLTLTYQYNPSCVSPLSDMSRRSDWQTSQYRYGFY